MFKQVTSLGFEIPEDQWRMQKQDPTVTSGFQWAKIDDNTYVARHSKHPEGPFLIFDGPEFDAFARGMRAGDFKFD
jgi:hypothetical protein